MKRRHKTGFGYLGFGNSQSVFNRKPRQVFSEIKDRLHTESQNKHQRQFTDHQLTSKERLEIKKKVRKSQKTKNILIFVLTGIILIFLIFVAIKMLEGVLFH